MKNKDLIEILNKLDHEKEVCICDWRVNLNSDTGEGSSEGIYLDFKVEEMNEADIKPESQPWISLSFKNPDYEDDGSFIDPNYR